MSYPDSYYSTRESWRDWRIEAKQLIDLARVSDGTRVLEIGCGGGGLLRQLIARRAHAVGVDTLPAALDMARRRTALSPTGARREECSLVCIGEDGRLPFGSESFDSIVGQHVLEHIGDVNAGLREFRRVLKPGGRLALATPNAHYPDPAHFQDADHVHVFTLSELRALVQSAGFRFEHFSTIFPFLSNLRILRGLGVLGYQPFRHLPYFATHGRTVLLSARRD